MEKNISLDQKNDYFSAKSGNRVVILSLNAKMLLTLTDLKPKEALFGYLDLVLKNDTVKVVILETNPDIDQEEEYFEFCFLLSKSEIDENALIRMYNAYNQLIIKIVESNKFFVSTHCGKVVAQSPNVSLACEYRIVADSTIFYNPAIQLRLIAKGGGALFPK